MSIMLQVVEEERLLHLALYASCKIADENDCTRDIADEVIFCYILDEFKKAGKETFDHDDIRERYSELVGDFALTLAVQDGMIEADMSGEETLYSLTDKGRKYAEKDISHGQG